MIRQDTKINTVLDKVQVPRPSSTGLLLYHQCSISAGSTATNYTVVKMLCYVVVHQLLLLLLLLLRV